MGKTTKPVCYYKPLISEFNNSVAGIASRAYVLANKKEFKGTDFKEFNKVKKLLAKSVEKKKSKRWPNNGYEKLKEFLTEAVEWSNEGQFEFFQQYIYELIKYIEILIIEILIDTLDFISSCTSHVGFALPLLENINETNDDKFTTKRAPGFEYLDKKQQPTINTRGITLKDLYDSKKLPKLSDIKQGSLGDCYLEAVLQNLAKNNPTDLAEKINIIDDPYGGIGKIELTLYRVKEKNLTYEAYGEEQKIRFLATELIDSESFSHLLLFPTTKSLLFLPIVYFLNHLYISCFYFTIFF